MRHIFYITGVLAVLLIAVFSAGCTITHEVPATPVPTALPTAVPTQAVPAEVGQGQPLLVTVNGSAVLRISIDSKIFDSDAAAILKKGASWNPVPGTGEKALLLQVTTTYVSGTNAAVTLLPDSYEVYVNGIGYDAKRAAVLPSGYTMFEKTTILPGASYTGWFVYIVPAGNEKFGFDINELPLGFIRVDY